MQPLSGELLPSLRLPVLTDSKSMPPLELGCCNDYQNLEKSPGPSAVALGRKGRTAVVRGRSVRPEHAYFRDVNSCFSGLVSRHSTVTPSIVPTQSEPKHPVPNFS